MRAVELWREVEARAAALDLADAASITPPALTWARRARHPCGAALPTLPDSYRRLIHALGGYPMFGLGYYDREGFSFLPPSPMAVLSVDTFDAEGRQPRAREDGPTPCRFAFFAGYDLSDIEGWAFGEHEGRAQVWSVERSMAREPLGDFETWAGALFSEALARLDSADAATLAEWREGVAAETDPHRLFDYSIEGYPIGERTDADRSLHWVCEQAGSPYAYGVIDDDGRWRIPLGRRFQQVQPFTQGVAKVRLAGGAWNAPERWVQISPSGAVEAD